MNVFNDVKSLWRILLSIAVILMGLFLASILWQLLLHFSYVLLLVLSAWIIAYILGPIAGWLQKLRIPKNFSVAIVYLLAAVLLGGMVLLIAPIISDEVKQLALRVANFASQNNLQSFNNNVMNQLQKLGISHADAEKTVSQVTQNIQNYLQNIVNSLAFNITSFVSSIMSVLLNILITLILSFYIMINGRDLFNSVLSYVPQNWHETANLLEIHFERIFGGFVRAQLIIGLMYAFATWLALAMLGSPSGLLFSFIAGVLMVIPFIGPFIAVVPPIIIVFIDAPSSVLLIRLIILIVFLIIAQQIILQILAPRIMGQSIGLHPFWVFIALLVGAREAGIWGAFFAAPVAALLVYFVKDFYAVYKQRSAAAANALKPPAYSFTEPETPLQQDPPANNHTAAENPQTLLNS